MALSIVTGTVDDVDSLEPLWVGVHRVHADSMPELAPYVSDAETLAVTEERRGEGIGGALMDAVERELAARGLDDVMLGVLPGNAGAIRLYERRGFRPTWMYMSRFAGR